jgi:hypothetical protein
MRSQTKRLIATAAALTLTFTAPLSWAGGGHGRGHYYGGHGHYYGGHGHYYRGHGHYYHRHGHHNGDDDEVWYLVGGLLLGGVLTHAYHTSQARAYAPAAPAYAGYAAPTPSRRLVRDAAGNCYESYFDASGAEIRVPVSPQQCAW